MPFLNNIALRSLLIFIGIISAYSVLYLISREFIFNVDLVSAKSSLKISSSTLYTLKSKAEPFGWYIALQLISGILFKIAFVLLCLYVGFSLRGIKVQFKQLLYIIICAEIVFVLNFALDIIWVYFHKQDYTYHEIVTFYSTSVLNIFDIEKVPPFLVYPLQTLNLFELFYIAFIAWGLSKLLDQKFYKAFAMTFVFYGIGMMLWIIFCVFMDINSSNV